MNRKTISLSGALMIILVLAMAVAAQGGANFQAFLPLIQYQVETLCEEAADGPTIHTLHLITEDTTWTAAASPHIITQDLALDDGVTLTIEPCAEVQLAAGVRFNVGSQNRAATLLAQGEAGRPIRFTAHDEEAWRYLRVTYPGMAALSHVTLEKGGGDLTALYRGATLVVEGDNQRPAKEVVAAHRLTVKESGGYGVWLRFGGAFHADSVGLFVSGSGSLDSDYAYPVRIWPEALTTLPVGSYGHNDLPAIHVNPLGADPLGRVWRDTVISDVGVPYHLSGSGDFWIEPATGSDDPPLLSLAAGVILSFDPDVSLHVREGARLETQGTSARPALFTAWDSDASWGAVTVHYPATAAFTHTIIEDGGGRPGLLWGESLSIRGDNECPAKTPVTAHYLTVRNAAGYGARAWELGGFAPESSYLTVTGSGQSQADYPYPVSLEALALGTLPPGEYTGNAADAIHVRPLPFVTCDVTVRDWGVPYHVSGPDFLRVRAADPEGPAPTLTVTAGVEMRFDAGDRLEIGSVEGHPGALQVLGAAGQPVLFTSAEAEPAPGDWSGIVFRAAPGEATNLIQYAQIRYAGGPAPTLAKSCPDDGYGDDGALLILDWLPEVSFVSQTDFVDSAAHAIVRGQGYEGESPAPWPDFKSGNSFENVAGCDQTLPYFLNCSGCG